MKTFPNDPESYHVGLFTPRDDSNRVFSKKACHLPLYLLHLEQKIVINYNEGCQDEMTRIICLRPKTNLQPKLFLQAVKNK